MTERQAEYVAGEIETHALYQIANDIHSLATAIQLTPTSLTLAPETTLSDVDQIARLLSEAEARTEAQASQIAWWTADLLASDSDEIAGQVSAHFAPQTCRNRAYVSRHVPLEVRRPGLTFSHHAAVASLPVDLQDQLLSLAETKSLTRADLREAVTDLRHQTIPLVDRVKARLQNALTTAEEIQQLAQGLDRPDREQIGPLAARIAATFNDLL